MGWFVVPLVLLGLLCLALAFFLHLDFLILIGLVLMGVGALFRISFKIEKPK